MKKSLKIPKTIYMTDFELTFENFQESLKLTKKNSTLFLTIILIYIEIFSRMFYPSYLRSKSIEKLLKEIGIIYPNLCWYMFRNGCVHKSAPQSIEVNRNSIKQIWWGTTFGETSLTNRKQHYSTVESISRLDENLIYLVHIKILYNNLLLFLKKQNTSQLKFPDIQKIEHKDNPKVIEEIDEITKKYYSDNLF